MNPNKQPPVTEELTIGILVADILRLLRQDFASRTRGMPLTPALHRALIYVQRNPGCRQVELAEWLDVTPVTVGRMIDRLERQRLVRRTDHPVDRRASCLFVAEGAGELLARLNVMANETRERAVAGLAPEERQQLLASLSRVRDNLATNAAQRPPHSGAA